MDAWSVVLFMVAAVGLLMVFSGARAREQARITARLAAVERKLDAVMTHLGVSEPPLEVPDVLQHLRAGNRIQAIKAYRDSTGASLAVAKETVDRIAREQHL